MTHVSWYKMSELNIGKVICVHYGLRVHVRLSAYPYGKAFKNLVETITVTRAQIHISWMSSVWMLTFGKRFAASILRQVLCGVVVAE